MLKIVCFKWKPFAGYRSHFKSEHVNTLRRMIDRHYADPHEVICITDDPVGIDQGITILPLWDDFARIPSPHGGKNPSCYRRLKLFSTEAAQLIGERFAVIDLDCVVTGDLRGILNRPEDFVIWGGTNPRTAYNGSLFLMTAGARKQVFEQFNPSESPRRSYNAGHFGSDQGWISFVLGPKEVRWTKADGVFSFRNDIQQSRSKALPAGAKLVLFHGGVDPWSQQAQEYPWIRQHYC